MRKGLLIHNLKAGSLDVELLPKLVSALGEVVSVDIEQLGEAGEASQYAEANHCDWIAVAGGDGTVESVASNLLGTRFPLGIIPTGTFNNFARSLGLPLDPIEACHVILAGNDRPTDVGFANGRPFFECLGSGLDAALYPLGEEIKSGSDPQVVRFHAPRLPISAPKIRARARPTSVCCTRARINERKPSPPSFSDPESRIESHTFGPDAYRLQWPLFWNELCRCPGTAHGRWASYRFGFQPLQQTSTLVALCLHRLWTPRILSEIHRLLCRKAASGRPTKTAGSPRRLSSEGSLATRR